MCCFLNLQVGRKTVLKITQLVQRLIQRHCIGGGLSWLCTLEQREGQTVVVVIVLLCTYQLFLCIIWNYCMTAQTTRSLHFNDTFSLWTFNLIIVFTSCTDSKKFQCLFFYLFDMKWHTLDDEIFYPSEQPDVQQTLNAKHRKLHRIILQTIINISLCKLITFYSRQELIFTQSYRA